MTNKQKLAIASMCAIAAILAALLLWRPSATPAAQGSSEHAGHQDDHGHDDRHAPDAPPAVDAGADRAIVMTAAQVRANGIGIDTAQAAALQDRLHLPSQIRVDGGRSVAIAAPAQGIVQAVLVAPGATVKKGQALVTLLSPAVAQWRADASIARQRLQLARTIHAREQTLWDQRISARQDLDAAQASLREAEIALQAAQVRLAALGIDGSRDGVSSVVTVRAPLGGVVIDRPAVPGQKIDETKALLTVADLAQVWIEAAVPADSLGQVGIGMAVKVSVNAIPAPLDGVVSFVDPVLGETTRMATARVTLANPGLRLRPGMLATVDLLGQEVDVPVTVVSEAIQTIHEHHVVFVRTASGFRAQDVTPGRSDGRRTEIVAGLAAGTPYAASGSFLLKADLGKSDAGHED